MSPSRTRRTALAALAVMAAGSLARRALGRSRRRFPYLVGSLTPDARVALTADGAWVSSSAVVAPGVSLNGIIRRPADRRAPWILFYPGNDATPLATARRFLDLLRGDHDWGCAVWAYRGYDSSDGAPARDALAADASRLYDGLLEAEGLPPERLNVLAFSMGGYLAASAVSRGAQSGRAPASLSLLASVRDVEMTPAGWAARLFGGERFDIDPLLDSLPAPVLVLQGGADETLGVESGRVIAARLGSRARYLELPGVGHNDLLASVAAADAVRGMIGPVRTG